MTRERPASAPLRGNRPELVEVLSRYSDETRLQAQERAILRKLQMLMGGAGFNYDKASIHRGVAASSEPPGTNLDSLEGGESPELSLWAFHRKRLEDRCEAPISVRLVAVAEAERDYETAIRRPPAYIDGDSDKNTEERDLAVLRWEGKPAEWVATFEGCSFAYVRKLRRLHKLKQNDGMPLEDAA